MSEEKKVPSPAPELDHQSVTEAPAEQEQTAAEAEVEAEEAVTESSEQSEDAKAIKQKKSERSVMRYISVLFGAAFLLLLITFVMENRQHQQAMTESQAQIENLSEKSDNAVARLKDTVEENERLKEKLEEYEEIRKTWFDEKEELQAYAFDMKKSTQAMDWFWQIDEAYAQKRYALAQELIEKFEATGLVELLPKLSSTGTDRLSPYERYAEIRDKVM